MLLFPYSLYQKGPGQARAHPDSFMDDINMDIPALQFESRFSFSPNALGYCGRDSANAAFKQCLCDGKCHKVLDELPHFIVLHPYLQTIGQITGLDPFSYPVIESYWLGNDLLKQVKPKHYDLLLEYFAKQGVPDWLIDELKAKPPTRFIPTHLFQVLHVGVGRASGSVPFNLDTINSCMIRWGEVQKITSNTKHQITNNNQAEITLKSLKKNGDHYSLTKKTEKITFDSTFIPELKVGNTVAVHWNWVVKILTQDEEKLLEHWTKSTLVIFN